MFAQRGRNLQGLLAAFPTDSSVVLLVTCTDLARQEDVLARDTACLDESHTILPFRRFQLPRAWLNSTERLTSALRVQPTPCWQRYSGPAT